MVVKQEIKKKIPVDAKDAYKNLVAGIKNKGWDIAYKDEERLEIFGITSAFAGSTVLSLAIEAVRYVPFFVKIFPEAKRCTVLAIAAGSEKSLGWDFGKNKKVAEKILDMCSGK